MYFACLSVWFFVSKKLASNKIWFSYSFFKSRNIFYKIRKVFVYLKKIRLKDEREVPRNPGFGKSLGNCLKFSQSKCRLQISNSQSEAGKFCAQSMRELLLVGNWNPARISKRGLSKTSKVSPVDIEIKGTGSSVSSSDIVIWCKNNLICRS